MARSQSIGIQGTFFGMETATLTALQTSYTACLTAIATAGASYTIAGRQYTRANLEDVRQTLAEINAAITRNAGTGVTQTFGRFC